MKRKVQSIMVIILALLLGFWFIECFNVELNILNVKIWQMLSISYLYTAILYLVLSLFNTKTIEKKYNFFFVLVIIGIILWGISYLVTLFA